MKNEEFDFEFKIRTSAELSNVITSYMMENGLTLEVLDLAYKKVVEAYRKNATIRKYEGQSELKEVLDDFLEKYSAKN